jgi:hypothetical protein
VTDFLGRAPTLDTNWRVVVLFGRNVASYKFALAKMLLELADRADDRVPLLELAAPFTRHLCKHLHQVDKQAASGSSKFLDSCRAFNKGELTKDRERNNWLVDSHHPLRETILLQTGTDAESRASFLRSRQKITHEWSPVDAIA